jgi:hypothetical protein
MGPRSKYSGNKKCFVRKGEYFEYTKMPADNLRFGATAAEARMNLSCEFEKPCAAEMFVEAAAAPSRCVVVGNAGESAVKKAKAFRKKVHSLKKSCNFAANIIT